MPLPASLMAEWPQEQVAIGIINDDRAAIRKRPGSQGAGHIRKKNVAGDRLGVPAGST